MKKLLKNELKSKKDKIVTENLKKKKICNGASPPRHTLSKIPGAATVYSNIKIKEKLYFITLNYTSYTLHPKL